MSKTKEDTITLAEVEGYLPAFQRRKSRLNRAEIVKLLEAAKAEVIRAAECLGADIDFEDFEPDYEAVQWAQDIVIAFEGLKEYGKALAKLDAKAETKVAVERVADMKRGRKTYPNPYAHEAA